MLWDLRQKVGHSTRSVAECLRQARGDMTIRTTLLEARFILGDEAAVRRDARALRSRDRARSTRANSSPRNSPSATSASRAPAPRAISSSPTSRKARAGCATCTRCSGSRKYVYRVREPPRSSSRRACSRAAELKLFERCEEFLWRVRCHLHFVDRTRRGAPELRHAARDRRQARLLSTRAAFRASNAS